MGFCDRVIEIIKMFPVNDIDCHLPGKSGQLARAESGTTVTLSCAAPRVMVPLCCSAKAPLRPCSVPLTHSIATYPGRPFDARSRTQHLSLADSLKAAMKLLIDRQPPKGGVSSFVRQLLRV